MSSLFVCILLCAFSCLVSDEHMIVKYVPDWFPGTTFKGIANGYRETMIETKDSPYYLVKEDVVCMKRICIQLLMLF